MIGSSFFTFEYRLTITINTTLQQETPHTLQILALSSIPYQLNRSAYPLRTHFATMAELMFGLGQTKKKKESEAKIKYTKASLKDVTITETVESNARSEQHGRDQKYKEAQRETKKNLKDVTQEESGEMAFESNRTTKRKNGNKPVEIKLKRTRNLTWQEVYSVAVVQLLLQVTTRKKLLKRNM